MASLSTLQKLFKNSYPTARILTSLRKPSINSPNRTPPLAFAPQIQQINSTPTENQTTNAPFTHLDSLPFLSIHPFGLCSYPFLSTGCVPVLPNAEDSRMWADSVKKKRKKKMNKHKYKKLRKRLGRQA